MNKLEVHLEYVCTGGALDIFRRLAETKNNIPASITCSAVWASQYPDDEPFSRLNL